MLLHVNKTFHLFNKPTCTAHSITVSDYLAKTRLGCLELIRHGEQGADDSRYQVSCHTDKDFTFH